MWRRQREDDGRLQSVIQFLRMTRTENLLPVSRRRGSRLYLCLQAPPAGAGSPSHNALRINYIINCRLSRDPLVVSDVRGVKSTVS